MSESPNHGLSQLQCEGNLFLDWEGREYPMLALDERHFVVKCSAIASLYNPTRVSPICNGKVLADGTDPIAVMFRVENIQERVAHCTFFDLIGEERDRVNALINEVSGVSIAEEPVLDDEASWGAKWLLAGLAAMVLFGLLLPRPSENLTANAVVDQLEIDEALFVGDASLAKIDAEIGTTQAQLEELKSVVAQQAEVPSKVATQLAAIEEQVQSARSELKDNQQLLQTWAPLIADENIGALEVKELQNRITSTKLSLQEKQRKLEELKLVNRTSKQSPADSKIKLYESKLDRLRRQRDSVLASTESPKADSPESGVVQAMHVQETK